MLAKEPLEMDGDAVVRPRQAKDRLLGQGGEGLSFLEFALELAHRDSFGCYVISLHVNYLKVKCDKRNVRGNFAQEVAGAGRPRAGRWRRPLLQDRQRRVRRGPA